MALGASPPDPRRALIFRPRRLVLASLIACGGCLGVNPQYQLPVPSTATVPVRTFGETTSLDSPSTASTSTPTASVSAWTTQSSTLSTSVSSSEVSSTSSSSTFSSSVSTDTTNPVGTRQGDWTEIRLDLGPATGPAEFGYSVQLEFDHAALVGAGAASAAQDIAIVFVSSGQGTSIDRVLDPQSSWNDTKTKIWFALQSELAPNSTMRGAYYLVRDSADFPAKSDPNQVFLLFDDFENGEVDSQKWRVQRGGGGASGIESKAFGITMHASSFGVSTESRSLRSVLRGRLDGVIAESYLRFPKDLNNSCNRFRPMALETTDDRVRHSLGIHWKSWQHVRYAESQDQLVTEQLPLITVDQTWHRYSLSWQGSTLRATQDDQVAFSGSTSNDAVQTADAQELHFRMHIAADTGTCTDQASSDMDVDWVWLRHFSSPEPSASLVP